MERKTLFLLAHVVLVLLSACSTTLSRSVALPQHKTAVALPQHKTAIDKTSLDKTPSNETSLDENETFNSLPIFEIEMFDDDYYTVSNYNAIALYYNECKKEYNNCKKAYDEYFKTFKNNYNLEHYNEVYDRRYRARKEILSFEKKVTDLSVLVSRENTAFAGLPFFAIKNLDSSEYVLASLEETEKKYEECSGAYSNYLSQFEEGSKVYNQEHYSKVEQMKTKAESDYLAFIQAYSDFKAKKTEKEKESLNNAFSILSKAYEEGRYSEIEKLHTDFTKCYNAYTGEDEVGELYDKATQILKTSIEMLWKQSDLFNDLISSIPSAWLDLPLYVSSHSLGKSLREAIEKHDGRGELADVTVYPYSNKMVLNKYYTFLFWEEDYTFSFEVKNERLVIKSVTSQSNNVYSETSPRVIITYFEKLFDPNAVSVERFFNSLF